MKPMNSQERKLLRQVKQTSPKMFCYLTENDQTIERYQNKKVRFDDNIKQLIKAANIKIKHGDYEYAYYMDGSNTIYMPYQKYFSRMKGMSRQQNYYGRFFHELTHWTGHISKCNRDCSKVRNYMNKKKFDSALEEMIAELGSIMLMQYFCYTTKPAQQSLGYINAHLIEIPQEHREKYFTKAVRQATAAVDLITKRYI